MKAWVQAPALHSLDVKVRSVIPCWGLGGQPELRKPYLNFKTQLWDPSNMACTEVHATGEERVQ